MTIELTFLGTGTSQGVPMIACDCAVCRSHDPRDRRSRTSCLLSLDGHNVLIDATPELRLQCLANDVRALEAVLITHTHADHIFGLDDVRRFNQISGRPIDIYAAEEHITLLEKVFGYARADLAGGNPDLPQMVFHRIDGEFSLFGQRIIPLPLPHGRGRAMGYRLGSLAYCTDLSTMPEEVIEQLAGLDVLVLGALRPRPHPTHLSFEQAVRLARRIGARHTYFVHMSHDVGHSDYEQQLGPGIALAHDGLTVTI